MVGTTKAAPSVVTNFSDITFSTTSSIRSVRERLANFEGRQGKKSKIFCEREKRHFPDVHNKVGQNKHQTRGRRNIPHGYGDDKDWTPHNQYMEPQYTEAGPDWKSSIRWIPSPKNVDYVVENWPEPWYQIRSFPGKQRKTNKEYAFYPDPPSGFNVAKRCIFDDVHLRSIQTKNELNDKMLFGKHKKVEDRRGSIPVASPGDKSYQAVEYSNNFHKFGSTRPVVNFGGNMKERADTFVPLHELPAVPRESYWFRERQRLKDQEMNEVRSLELWRPATPLVQPSTHNHELLTK